MTELKNKILGQICGRCGSFILNGSLVECGYGDCPVPMMQRVSTAHDETVRAAVEKFNAPEPAYTLDDMTVLTGEHIVIPPYADLALLLDRALGAWVERRKADEVSPVVNACSKQCGAYVCMEGVIGDTLQMLAAQILSEVDDPEHQAAYIQSAIAAWPRAIAEVRGMMADAKPGSKAN